MMKMVWFTVIAVMVGLLLAGIAREWLGGTAAFVVLVLTLVVILGRLLLRLSGNLGYRFSGHTD